MITYGGTRILICNIPICSPILTFKCLPIHCVHIFIIVKLIVVSTTNLMNDTGGRIFGNAIFEK